MCNQQMKRHFVVFSRNLVTAWIVLFEVNPFLCNPLIIWRVVSIVCSVIGDKYVYDWNLFSLSNTRLRYCRPLWTTYPPDMSYIVQQKFMRNGQLVIFKLAVRLPEISLHRLSCFYSFWLYFLFTCSPTTHIIFFWKIIAVHCLEIWFPFNKK